MTNKEALNLLKIECDNCIKVCEYCHIKVAIDAIEKQIQEEPVKRVDYSTNTELSKNETPITEYYCSNCNKRIYVSENFCTQCG